MYNTLIITAIAVIIIVLLLKKQFKMAKKIYSLEDQIESQTGKTDLELATINQIVTELAKRPNYRFMLITPHAVREDENAVDVEIHSSNISLPMALEVLRATFAGVSQTIKQENPDEDIEDLEEEGE